MTSLRNGVSHVASVGVAVALACAMAACNGSAGMPMTSPSAPGATIQGTVEGAGVTSAAARAASAASKIRVSVVGTGLSTVTDSSGRFVLTGLPGGSVGLRFEGPGIHATLDVGGLTEGQVLTITVNLSGSRATLVSPGLAPHTEFTGAVESLTPPTLQVSGRTVVTDGNTKFEGSLHSLADVRLGDRVKVEGTATSTGSILAREIKRLGGNGGNDESEVEFKGSIESITPPGLRVAGRTVLTDGNTRIERDDRQVGLTELKIGETAKVEGTALADGSVLARKIEVGQGRGGDDDEGDHDDGEDDDAED